MTLPTSAIGIAMLCLGLINTHAQTVRVRNQPVDLTPIVEWLKDRKAERPMAHWKFVKVTSILSQQWGGHLVGAEIEGQSHTVLIQNIPSDLIEIFNRHAATLRSIADIEARMEAIERMNREIDVNLAIDGVLSDTYRIDCAQKVANENALAELGIAYSIVRFQRRMLTALQKRAFLAHFTGAEVVGGPKLGQVEVWDCGVGAKCLPTVADY